MGESLVSRKAAMGRICVGALPPSLPRYVLINFTHTLAHFKKSLHSGRREAAGARQSAVVPRVA